MPLFLRALALGFISLASIGCGQGPDSGQVKQSEESKMTKAPPLREPLGKPMATVGAPGLWEEYGANAIQADSKYKGKALKVPGTVTAIQADENGRYYVGLEVFAAAFLPERQFRALSEKEKKWYKEGYPPLVICYLDLQAQSKFEQVKKGQQIEIVGRCIGRKKDPSGFKDYIVVLEDCRMAD